MEESQRMEFLTEGEGGEEVPASLPTAETPLIVDFEAVEGPKPCSVNRCTKGHEWPIRMQVVVCRGCKGQVLVKLAENCPWCNEPIADMHIRIDQLMAKQQVVRACMGEAGINTGDITITRTEDQLEPDSAQEPRTAV